jgi:hypothetical protein
MSQRTKVESSTPGEPVRVIPSDKDDGSEIARWPAIKRQRISGVWRCMASSRPATVIRFNWKRKPDLHTIRNDEGLERATPSLLSNQHPLWR